MCREFLETQKNQLFDLQDHLKRHCNVLPVFGFNSLKYHIKLKKSYLLPRLVNEPSIEPILIKKANQFVLCKFGDVQLLDILKFFGGATSLDSFLKALKNSETKSDFPYECFDNVEKLHFFKLPSYKACFSKLRNKNPLDKDF